MPVYATEFPVSENKTSADFIAEIATWIKGIESANLFSENALLEHRGNEALAVGENEDLFVREVPLDGGMAYAARYEIKDQEFRLWRIDVIYAKRRENSAVRVKAQCIALDNRAHIAQPRKPHIIRQMLEAGWGCLDGYFEVSIYPHRLKEADVLTAKNIFSGINDGRLPIVYVSRNIKNTLPLDVDRLSKELAGLAHVVIEPSREFSRNLDDCIDITHSKAQGGAIGLCVAKYGMIKKLYGSSDARAPDQLLKRITSAVVQITSNSAPVLSLSWQEVQEISLQSARKTQGDDILSAAEALYKDEISLKDETIIDLKRQLREMQEAALSTMSESDGLLPPNLVANIGPEIYDGEFSERLVNFLSSGIRATEADPRTREMLSRIIEAFSKSGRATALHREMKIAAKSCTNSTDNLRPILARLGFSLTQDGKHLKATPNEYLFGVSVITLSLTPGDYRTPDNVVRDIFNGLHLTKLK